MDTHLILCLLLERSCRILMVAAGLYDYFDLSAGDIAVEISRQALGHADGWSFGIIIRKGEIYRGRWIPPAFVCDSSQQMVSGVAHFCASLLSESN